MQHLKFIKQINKYTLSKFSKSMFILNTIKCRFSFTVFGIEVVNSFQGLFGSDFKQLHNFPGKGGGTSAGGQGGEP